MIPTEAKNIFKNRFPNININQYDIDNYIKCKHREMKKIHSEKIKNTKSLFEMQDKNGNIISKTFEYTNL